MADDLNYYEVLGVTRETSQKEITKAYRRKARECHPDKNPDDPVAAALFHKLSKALEVLTDPKAKAALDSVLRAKERDRLRTQALDAKRKKFKLDLEEQENAAKKNEVVTDKNAAKRLQEEIERLREEGSRLLSEQQELLKKEMREEQLRRTAPHTEDSTAKLKVRWKSKKSDESNGGYSQEMLEALFSKYGEVNFVVVSTRKKGSAVVEYKSPHSAKMAQANEQGLVENPLMISWLDGQEPTGPARSEGVLPEAALKGDLTENSGSTPTPTAAASNVSDRDYESITLMRMRQAQERKRLAEQLEVQEDEEG